MRRGHSARVAWLTPSHSIDGPDAQASPLGVIVGLFGVGREVESQRVPIDRVGGTRQAPRAITHQFMTPWGLWSEVPAQTDTRRAGTARSADNDN